MGGMPDWFAKTKEMVASDLYFSLADAKTESALTARYHEALSRLETAPKDYARKSAALQTVWKDPKRVSASLDGHFVGDWIHYRYHQDPAKYGAHGGAFWPSVASSLVVNLVRAGTRLAIHKALGAAELATVSGLSSTYRDDIWAPERANGVDVDGVRPLATSWNCVAPAGATYFEVAALRGPSVVEFAIATPKPYGHSSMMHVIEKVLDDFYTEETAS